VFGVFLSNFSWPSPSAGLDPVLVLSVPSKGARKGAVAIGMVCGVLFVYVLPMMDAALDWTYVADPLAPGCIGSTMLIVGGLPMRSAGANGASGSRGPKGNLSSWEVLIYMV
jgi:hypothetical protein